MNGRLGNTKLNLPKILVDSREIYSIIMSKNMQIMRYKRQISSSGAHKEVTSIIILQEIVLTEIDATKSVMWNLHLGDSQ